jgi:hypothetical protein
MLTPKTLEMDMRPSAEAPDKTRRIQSIIPEETGFWRAATPPSRTSLEYARVLLEACDLSRESLKVAFHDAPNDSTNSASTDLLPATDWAQSGAMALTGHPNTAPRFANGPLASAMRGAASVLAALAPNTPLVDLEGPALLGERAALFGLTRQGSESPGGSARLLPSQSASLVLNLPREDDWHLIPAWLEDPLDLGEIDLTHAVTSDSNHAAWTQIAERIAVRPAEQLIDRGRLMVSPSLPLLKSHLQTLPSFDLAKVLNLPLPSRPPSARPFAFSTSRPFGPGPSRPLFLHTQESTS